MGRKTILRNFAPVMQILYTAAGNRSISTELLKFRTEKSGKNVGQGKTLIVLINSFNELINSFNELISSFNELISSFNELISSLPQHHAIHRKLYKNPCQICRRHEAQSSPLREQKSFLFS